MNEKKERDNSKNRKRRILVVDGHPTVRRSLIELINQQPNFVVCAEAENADQALGAIDSQQVDLAIVDTALEGTSCAQLVEKIRLQCPNLPVLTIPTPEFLKE